MILPIGVYLFLAGLMLMLLKGLIELLVGEIDCFFLVVVEGLKTLPLVLISHYKCSLIFIAYT